MFPAALSQGISSQSASPVLAPFRSRVCESWRPRLADLANTYTQNKAVLALSLFPSPSSNSTLTNRLYS